MRNVIAVKDLAYFVCQSGDLSLEFFSNYDLKRGSEAHDYLQAKYNDKSKKEYYIKYDFTYLAKQFTLHGFIDGVLDINDEIIIEEIKSTTKELDELTIDYHKEHLAQLKIYSYLYAIKEGMDLIKTRLTYISLIDYSVRTFEEIYSLDELEKFVFDTLDEYISWINLLEENKKNKEKSISEITFPFKDKRPGQYALMRSCYQTLMANDILYTIAPTGIGKTMACLFSSLKSLKQDDKLFYLTAKGSGKNAPIDAVKILEKQGLKIKCIDITAKRKICNNKSKNCNPDECPFAIGYFDRLRIATYEIFKDYNIFDNQIITKISNKHKICAFEFSLYLSYFCDIVVADYNYVFDPTAHLIRYFEDDTYKPKVLVDEAHNLISRSKDMYSSSIKEMDIRIIRKTLNGYKPSVRSTCNKILECLSSYKDNMANNTIYVDNHVNPDLTVLFKQLISTIDQVFDDNKKIHNKDEVMDPYFKVMDMIKISDLFSTNHKVIAKLEDDEILVKYMCLDASKYLIDTIHNSIHGIIFFSATLYPIKYHSNLLTQGEGKFLALPSPFNPKNLDIIINNQISTKYKDRQNSIDDIIETIEVVINAHKGNYIVFFPSYKYLNMVYDNLEEIDSEIVIQTSGQTDDERQAIIDKFKNEDKSHLGFFVMGGAFSEGIDFIGDSLNGVIIVGVGLPLYCDENNVIKDYFNELYDDGFDYAYTYPGFTKVIQAVGRVIRTNNDKGIAVLMDERFTTNRYLSLMPPHWQNKKVINNAHDLKKELEDFYK